jgi:hypothetical protein
MVTSFVLRRGLGTTIQAQRHGEQAKCHGHGPAFSRDFIGLETSAAGTGA